jgi:long-chain acyl-CoA synthetase
VEPIWVRSYEPGVPAAVTVPPLTLYDLLAEAVRAAPDKVAVRLVLSYLLGGQLRVGGSMTYRELLRSVDRFAAALHRLGVRKGDRVAIVLPNSPQYLVAFFAAARLGAIIVNNNPTYTAAELEHQLADSGAETVIALNLVWPRLQSIPQGATAVRRVIVTSLEDLLPFPTRLLVGHMLRRRPDWVDPPRGEGTLAFADLLREDGPLPQTGPAPEDVALFQYTGGTTGTPKAAMLTHRNLIANTVQSLSWMCAIRPGHEVFLSAIPFFHVYGVMAGILCPLRAVSENVIIANPIPIDLVMEALEHERCTIFPGVPAMYVHIVRHPRVREFDLRSVRYCLSGAAPLPLAVQEQFGELTGGRLVEGYGLTECGPITHGNPLNGVRKDGSIGLPFPSTEVRLVDPSTGEELPPGAEQAGELVVRGPQVMRGYWNRPEETAAVFDLGDGWLRTGDICTADAEGYFRIVDRKKDIIKVSGFQVLPREVEEVLYRHPAVQEVCVAGVPRGAGERADEQVTAFVVLKPGATATGTEIRTYCHEHLVGYKVPRAVEFREQLPRTLVGKALRRALVAEALERRGAVERA